MVTVNALSNENSSNIVFNGTNVPPTAYFLYKIVSGFLFLNDPSYHAHSFYLIIITKRVMFLNLLTYHENKSRNKKVRKFIEACRPRLGISLYTMTLIEIKVS